VLLLFGVQPTAPYLIYAKTAPHSPTLLAQGSRARERTRAHAPPTVSQCPRSAYTDLPPSGGSDDAFARYGMANGFVVLKPCQGGPIDLKAFPDNHENRRGMVDVYGQLTPLYATQLGGQMAPTGKMIKRLLGAA